jgi:hypothetical protein
VNLVAFEMFPDAIGPGQQVMDVGGTLEIKEPKRFGSRKFASFQDPLAKFGQALAPSCVNLSAKHG